MRALRIRPFSLLIALAVVGGCSGLDEGLPSEPSRPVVRPVARRAPAVVTPAPSRPGRSSPPSASSGGPQPTTEDRRTFDEANRMRAEHGLEPLVWNDRLFRAAYDHSAEQARYGYMGHGSPDPSRDDLGDRLRFADCGPLRAWAEVVAWGYEGPATVVDGWMNSRGHRKILLDPNLSDAAFSRVGDYFTGDFLTSR